MTTTDDPGLIHLQDALTLDDDARDHPSPSFIETMQARYPTEREFDLMLTTKQRHRSVPRYPNVELPEMRDRLDAFLRAHLESPFEISRVRWLAGGGSKIQVAFGLDWQDPEQGRAQTEMVVRMEPQESLSATSRRRESELLRAFVGTLPVPRVFWVDADGTWFPEPALIYAFADGVTKPSALVGRPSGVASDFGPRLRPILGEQFVDNLAAMHTFDFAGSELASFDVPRVGSTESALWQLNRARRLWDEDRGHDIPLLEVASSWLQRNLPELDHVSVLHGDYRAGNFLFEEETGRVTAILDWERGYLGDRHRDLAWTALTQFGHYAEDGRTLLVSGLVAREEFFARYEQRSGLPVNPRTLRFYEILNAFQLIASTLGSAHRVVRLGRSHQDVLLAWIEGVVYSIAEDLRVTLTEVTA